LSCVVGLRQHSRIRRHDSNEASPEQQALLVQAARYADVRLAEIDARAAYVQQIHGGTTRT
jgi:hypothetical protein